MIEAKEDKLKEKYPPENNLAFFRRKKKKRVKRESLPDETSSVSSSSSDAYGIEFPLDEDEAENEKVSERMEEMEEKLAESDTTEILGATTGSQALGNAFGEELED